MQERLLRCRQRHVHVVLEDFEKCLGALACAFENCIAAHIALRRAKGD
jgi:hypothetical protein